ncbi:glycoside hydrolase family 51 protein [Gelatoporia subvermispora B]|uniref:non-reducing end alpha-L-arabinofuranosidase n=1 Tax=Ceriporiopsis subvermispora (strain B) TaxID=914234 RepID=M2QIK7_CERS8|nr:glycoside hydrolase family 51 protein [Gelatoporia subvermispora B]
MLLHRLYRFTGAAITLFLADFPICLAATTTVTISDTASHAVPTTLCKVSLISMSILSGDGGLYAELLQNRAFQQVTPSALSNFVQCIIFIRTLCHELDTTDALAAWAPINGALIAVVADPKPVSQALPNSLQFTVPSGASGPVGFSNEGFWGINVNASWTYNASLFFRFPTESSFFGTLTIGLQTASGDVLASEAVQIRGSQTSWTQIAVKLRPKSNAPDTNNLFFVTVDGQEAAGQTMNFAMLSLFPPTFKNRLNGMRIDIAETLAEMGPAFFRFPGGNNLTLFKHIRKGQSTGTRWQWNATVGSLLDRPGRVGDWVRFDYSGLGLLEYLTFFEDVGMEPIMAVWSGYSLDGDSLPENELAPYIQQAKDQINFVIGDAATSAPGLNLVHRERLYLISRPAALRASLGHPEPFTLHFVEVGNEDFFAANTYPYRWVDFVGNLSAEFPQLRYIATTDAWDPILSPTPPSYDVHVYQTPGWFAQNAFYYDSFERNGTTYFEGEYAAISTNANDLFGTPSDGRLLWPDMQSSTGEAAFMTGLERNSDIVFAASYAPLLQHVNSTQWTPDLISFDAGSVIRSTSYYAQKLFSLNVGDEYLPSTLPTIDGTLFWTVTRSSSSGDVFIKISNTVGTDAEIVLELPFRSVANRGTLQLLHGAQNASNTPEAPNAVVPVTSTISTGKTIHYTAPGFSVSVITVQAH